MQFVNAIANQEWETNYRKVVQPTSKFPIVVHLYKIYGPGLVWISSKSKDRINTSYWELGMYIYNHNNSFIFILHSIIFNKLRLVLMNISVRPINYEESSRETIWIQPSWCLTIFNGASHPELETPLMMTPLDYPNANAI